MSKQIPWFTKYVIHQAGMSAKDASLMIHEDARAAKRAEARDRSQRAAQVGLDLLHDGLAEVAVHGLVEADAPAKLPMDCEAVDYEFGDDADYEDRLPDWERAVLEEHDLGRAERVYRLPDWERAVLEEHDLGRAERVYSSDAAIAELRERLMGETFDYPEFEHEPMTDAEIDEAWDYYRNSPEYHDEPDLPESDAIWPPACSIQEVWDAMGYETGMRGYSIITPRP